MHRPDPAGKDVATLPPQTTDADWVARMADEVIAESELRAPGKPVVVASGLSPSGPIHLGNLREVMVPHLVADEVRRRGIACDHILSWDDFDRLRRVPVNIDQSWTEHIGRPLTSVPAPPGSPHASWADHFRAPMEAALARMGVEYRGISQTQMYTSGAYVDQVLLAMRERKRIDEVLGRYRTKAAGPVAGRAGRRERGRSRGGRRRGRGIRSRQRGRRRVERRLLPVQAVLLGLRPRLHDRHQL